MANEFSIERIQGILDTQQEQPAGRTVTPSVRTIGGEEPQDITTLGGRGVAEMQQQRQETSLERELNLLVLSKDPNATEAQALNNYSRQQIEAILDEATFSPDLLQERATRRIQELEAKLSDVAQDPDFAYEYIMATAQEDIDPFELRYALNMSVMERKIQELRARESQEGWVVTDAIGDFASMVLRDSTIGVPYYLSKGTEQEGGEVLARATRMTPGEFMTWFNDFAENKFNQGIGDNNAWYLDELESIVYNNGYDPSAAISQLFAIADLGGLVGGATKMGGRLVRGGLARNASTVSRTSAVAGAEEATELASERLVRRIDGPTQADAMDTSLTPHRAESTIAQTAHERIWRENDLVQQIAEYRKLGSTGRIIDETTYNTVVKADIERLGNKLATTVGYRLFNSAVNVDVLDNYTAVYQLAKVDGTPYKATKAGNIPQSLINRAEAIGGVVKQLDEADPTKGLVIELKRNIDATKYVGKLDDTKLAQVKGASFADAFGSFFGSAALRGVDDLNTAVQMGEAGASAIQGLFKKEFRNIERLGARENYRLRTLVTALRDDPNFSFNRNWFTPEQFAAEYRRRFDDIPSEKVMKAYDSTVAISDAAWIMKSDSLFKDFVTKGYRTVETFGHISPAKEVPLDTIPKRSRVIDGETGGTILREDFVGEGATFFRLSVPRADGVEFVANPRTIRELEPTDVLGYNAGGTRFNPNANYFVTLNGGQRLKALLTTSTEKQARLASDQLNTLVTAIREGRLTDDLIEQFNDWNPDIQTVKEFEEFGSKHGWFTNGSWRIADEDLSVGYKTRKNQVVDAGDVGGDESFAGLSISDYVRLDQSRQDTVLPDFGGGSAFNTDSVASISQSFANAANEFAFQAYNYRTMVGWVKSVRDIERKTGRKILADNIHQEDYRNLFLKTEITGNDAVSRRLREVQQIERRRMGINGEISQMFENLGENIAEYVFDSKVLSKVGGRSDFAQGLIRDPGSALLRVGFSTAFGFFNVAQMLVQSIHSLAIILISPQAGLKGASMAVTMRGLIHQAPEVIEEGLRRQAKFYGLSYEDMKEIYDYARTSGRDAIEGDAIELGTGASYGISSWGGRDMSQSALDRVLYNTTKYGRQAMDAGLAFYRTGERMSRMTGVYTAALEYKARNPGVSLLSDSARKWVTSREQTLGLNMTTSSRGMLQSGALRVPTQWLSYNLRAMEAVFVGRGLSVGERARLLGALVPFYGLAGFGAEKAAEDIYGFFGLETDNAVFTGFKYGVIDGITDALLPDTQGRVGTGLAPRLSVVAGIMDVYQKINEGKFIEVIGGPSGQIGGSVLGAFYNAGGNLLNNRPVNLTEDIIQILRQPSGIDNVFKAYGIFKNGLYQSKNGAIIPGQMTTTEGILALFGVASLKQTEWYTAREIDFRDNRRLTQFRTEMNRRGEIALRLLQSEDRSDIDRGIEMLEELRVQVTLSGFSPELQASLVRSVFNPQEDQMFKIQENLLKADRAGTTQRLQEVMQ